MRILLIAGAAISLAACAHNTQVEATSAPAAEVLPARVVRVPMTYQFTDDLAGARKTVRFSTFVCSAHTFETDFSYAMRETMRRTIEAGFPLATPADAGKLSGVYNIRLTLEEMNARVTAVPTFWSAMQDAKVSVVLRVGIADASGTEIVRAMISGEASDEIEGQCPEASRSLSNAATKAIGRAAAEFAYKIINSGVIPVLPPSEPARPYRGAGRS